MAAAGPLSPRSLLALATLVAVAAGPASAGGPERRIAFSDAPGDALVLAQATAPAHGDGAHDLRHVVLQVDGGHLRVTVATVGAVSTDPFAGYDVTARSSGTCVGTVFDGGFPVELRVRAGEDGRGALDVKACRAVLRVPVVVTGSTVTAKVPLAALPAVRRTTLDSIRAVAGTTDFPDGGTMRVILDDAATTARLAVP